MYCSRVNKSWICGGSQVFCFLVPAAINPAVYHHCWVDTIQHQGKNSKLESCHGKSQSLAPRTNAHNNTC